MNANINNFTCPAGEIVANKKGTICPDFLQFLSAAGFAVTKNELNSTTQNTGTSNLSYSLDLHLARGLNRIVENIYASDKKSRTYNF
jgi:hypothetical protein